MPEPAITVTCAHCGRPLYLPLGLDRWKADTGRVTCFDNPGPYRRHVPLTPHSARSTDV